MNALRSYPGAGAILAIIALCMSAMNPSGFMPRSGEDGFAIQLCSGAGRTTVAITPDHAGYERLALLHGADTKDPAEPAHDGDPRCEFAGAAGIAMPAVPSGHRAVILPVAAPAMDDHGIVRARHFALRPPATGPPLLI